MSASKRVLKIILFVATIFVALLIVLAGFTQTQFFKDRLRTIIVANISTQLNGSLTIGSIGGNLVTGFTLDSVAIYHQSDLVLSANRVLFSYDPLSFFRQTLKSNFLVIDRPMIYIHRAPHGQWNISELMKSQTAGPGTPYGGSVSLGNVQIKGGTISLVDSGSLAAADHLTALPTEVEYHNFTLEGLDVAFSAFLSREQYNVRIQHASFFSHQPEFQLTQFKGDFLLDPKRISAKNVVVQTGQSYLELDAELLGADVFSGPKLSQLRNDSTTLHLKANPVSFAELRSFLPSVNVLEGSASVECDARGVFGDLAVQRLNIRTYGSTLKLAGAVRNLHEPKDLYLDVTIRDSKCNAADVAKLLPSLGVPAFDNVGQSSLSASFKGTPKKFSLTTNLDGGYGSIQAKGEMNFEHDLPRYHLMFSTAKVDLGILTQNEKIKTSLTTTGEIQGAGFSVDTLTADLHLALGSSRVQEFTMDSSTISAHAVPHHISITSTLGAQQSKASIVASGDFFEHHLTSYHGEVTCTAFDFSKLFGDRAYESSVSLHGTAAGSGTTIDEFNGHIDVSLLPSLYQHRELPAEQLAITLDQHDSHNKQLNVTSSFADISCKGKFDIDLVVDALSKQSANLIRSVKEHALPPDSVAVRKLPGLLHLPPHTESQRELDFSYAVTVSDLSTVALIAGETDFNAHGSVKGIVKGTDDNMSLTADGTVDEFFIGSAADGIFLNSTALSIQIRNLTPINTLDQLSGKFNITIGSGISHNRSFDELHTTLDYRQLRGALSITGNLDSAYNVRLSGEASIQPNTYAFDLDTLIISSGEYRWKNNQDVQIRANADGFRVLHAEMKRKDESLSFSGVLHHDGNIDMSGKLDHYDLAGIKIWWRSPDFALPDHGFKGLVDSDFRLAGYINSPVISFAAAGENVYFHQTRIGTVRANISYLSQVATIDVSVRTFLADSTPSLAIKGKVPINLSFASVPERFPDEQQQMDIISEGFDVSVLDPLLADFDNVRGKLRCNVHIAGTPRNPQYSGDVSLTDLQFTFGPNNIPYIVNGEFEPRGDKIVIKSLSATNPLTELYSSDATFVGSADIKDFQISSFDVTAFGKLLLMTEATRKVIPTFYGPLFTEIGPEGLNLRGSLQQPFLSGKLFVLNSDLLFPPTKATEGVDANHILRYIAEDTVRAPVRTNTFTNRFFGKGDSLRPGTERARSDLSFVDRLRYNLQIETKGTTAIRMIFTPSTSEELYSEIEGKVNAVNDRGTASLYGEIAVTPRSYYNFFKRFEATGKLKFVGPWDNPELDIDAQYEKYHQVPVNRESDPSAEQRFNVEEKVIVELKITGTRYEPKLQMGVKVQSDPSRDPEDRVSGDVQSDAISFILTGKFRDELSASERDNLATNFGSAGVTGVTSNLLSSMLSDFLRKEFPFIRNAEFTYEGGNVSESADVGITGEAFKGYWRIRGKILNDIGNANLSYQTSVGEIFNLSSIRNLFIELERKVEGSDLNAASRLTTNNARLFYRFSF